MAAGFEQSLKNRLGSSSGHDPPETNLDYYAKPENYEGSNIHTISRFVRTSKKEEQSKQTIVEQDENPALTRMFDRYKDVCAPDISKMVTPTTPETDNSTHQNNSNNKYYSNHSNKVQYNGIGLTYSQTMTEISLSRKPFKHKERKRSVAEPPKENRVFTSPQIYRHSSYNDPEENNNHCSPNSEIQVEETDTTETSKQEVVDELQRRISNLSLMSDVYRSATTSTTSITPGKDVKIMLAKQKFRHAIKLVLILLKWISTLTEKEDAEGNVKGGKTFTDIASEAFDEAGRVHASGIAFDVSQFKARKEMSVSNEVKHVLSIPSRLRTPEQLQTALFGLQHLKSFAEYPLHMQEKLCKVAWFQQVPHKKVIIRQGHFAENFYFILAGQAVVRILDKNPKTGEVSLRTAAVMRKGTSFGELALLHRSRRTATVVSQDMVQLLSIGREDFLDIFMSRSGPDDIPDHITFIAGLEFINSWPVDKLLEHPECCLFHFFKRGVVIVKDSNQSEWLYIVKSGSCQVLKRLNGVQAQMPHKKPKTSENEEKDNFLPELDIVLTPAISRIDTGRKKISPKTVRVPSSLRRAMEEYREVKALEPSIVEFSPTANPAEPLPTSTAATADQEITPNSRSAAVRISASQANHAFTPGFSKSRFGLLPKSKDFNKPRLHSPIPSASASSSAHSSSRRTKSARTPRITTDTQTKDKHKAEDHSAEPVFVQMETLKPRDIFGLSSVHFEDIQDPGTSVSLISNGAECIMLSKKFFIAHATEHTKKVVRLLAHPYPSEESLQSNLQTKVDWDVYKHHLVSETVNNINIFKHSNDKFVTLPDVGTYAM